MYFVMIYKYLLYDHVYNVTYWEHMLTRSLSVVFWLRPRMYRFVLDSCSACWPCMALLLRFVLIVPLWLPVALLELLLVFAVDEAVGTRCPPYCKHHQYCVITDDDWCSKRVKNNWLYKAYRFYRIDYQLIQHVLS